MIVEGQVSTTDTEKDTDGPGAVCWGVAFAVKVRLVVVPFRAGSSV